MRYLIAILMSFIFSQSVFATKHFIIDTDAASDDAIAILYLLQCPDIKIEAITIVGNGEVPCAPALRNMRGLTQLMQQPAIPMACGGEALLPGQHRFPGFLTHQQATLSGTNLLLPNSQVNASRLSSVDLLIKVLNESPEPVTILSLGPLTNLAAAFSKSPGIKKQIKEIFVMGGAVFVPGNIIGLIPKSPNKVAEWNIYVDPASAQFVLEQEVPITLIPLDVTDKVPLKLSFYNKLENNREAAATQYVFALLTGNLHWIRTNNFYFWDPLAAVIASDPSIARFSQQPLKVVTSPETQAGRTMRDTKNGHSIRVVMSIDKKRFEKMLLTELNRA